MTDLAASSPPVPRSLRRRAVHLTLRSLATGVGLGVAVRLAMRFVALEACVPQGFSPGGSLEVVAAATLLGAPLAAAFFVLRARLSAHGCWPGLLWGAGVFVTLALLPPPAARSALAAMPDTPAATALAFAVCFVAWGLLLDQIARRSIARHPLSAR